MEKDYFLDRPNEIMYRDNVPNGTKVFICTKQMQPYAKELKDLNLITITGNLTSTYLHSRGQKVQGVEIATDKYESKERNKELSDSLKQLEVEYKNSVQSISESIQSALGLFDKFESSTDKTSKDLIDNMYSQVLASEQYYDTMEKLRKRGVSENLLEDLQQAGIKDLETLKVIANMTDNELQQFQRLYNKRNEIHQ